MALDAGERDARAEAWRVGEQVAAELEVVFAETGFYLSPRGADPVCGRAFVAIDPIPADMAARLVEKVREWSA